jgi:hypothetical protein
MRIAPCDRISESLHYGLTASIAAHILRLDLQQDMQHMNHRAPRVTSAQRDDQPAFAGTPAAA